MGQILYGKSRTGNYSAIIDSVMEYISERIPAKTDKKKVAECFENIKILTAKILDEHPDYPVEKVIRELEKRCLDYIRLLL